jgi:hypothetical protein
VANKNKLISIMKIINTGKIDIAKWGDTKEEILMWFFEESFWTVLCVKLDNICFYKIDLSRLN